MKLSASLLLALAFPFAGRGETVTLLGSGTVATAITPAIEEFKKATGVQVELQMAPSLRGVFGVAEGKADIGLTIAPVTDAQRQLYPAADFRSTSIGRGAIYLIVSPDVWAAGVHALSREQVAGIVEKRTANWIDLGGPDVSITFLPPGAGSLTNFGAWLYGKSSLQEDAKIKAAATQGAGGSGTGSAKRIGVTRGALGALSEFFRPGESEARKLAITTPDGPMEPTRENVGSGRYPISFDLRLITNGPPRGAAKTLVDFLLGGHAQALIEAEGYARLASGTQRISK